METHQILTNALHRNHRKQRDTSRKIGDRFGAFGRGTAGDRLIGKVRAHFAIFSVTIGNAFSSLLVNKVRAALTMLGVIIGVAAIMTTTSIGEGARADITVMIQNLGANLLVIRPGQQQLMGRRLGEGSVQTLKYEDALF